MEKDKDEDIDDNVPKNAAIWIEKYRPSTFLDIKGQDDIKKKVQAFIKQGNMPHLMFSGPPGTGKSTMAIVVAKKMFGENWRQNFLELNASVTGDTPIMVKINGKTKRTNFSEIADIYFKNDETRVLLDDIEVLSINNDYKVKYSKVNYLFRHKVNKIVKIKYEGGEVKASMNHSLIVFDKEGNLKSIKAEELKKGDLLITFKTELEENKNIVNVLLPADIFQNILKSQNLKNARLLRHSMYSKKSKRVSRNIALKLLNLCKNKDKLYLNAKKLVESDLSVIKITGVSNEVYDDYVYDFSVPEAQMFWGGTMPVLLHNSDERGIDVVRHKVKDFARTRALGNVPFKIIFLDESDALTKEAQQALRRTMENYTTTCRFILSNNYSSKIIDPIQSRCTLFRFKPLEKKDVLAIIENIEEKEKIKIDQKAKEALFEISEGDCRKLENILQSCAALGEKITEELVFSMASIAKPAEVKDILELAVKNKFIDARNKLLDTMLKYGLSGQDIIKQIQKQILELNIDDRMKVQLIDKCGEIEFRMTEGSDEYLQLEALLANFTLCSKKE